MTHFASVARLVSLFALSACGNSTAPAAHGNGGAGNGGTAATGGMTSSTDASGGASDAGLPSDAGPVINLDGSTLCNVSSLPSSFTWTSTGALISAVPDSTHNLVAVKDPTIVFYNDKWHVYATSVDTSGHWSMLYLNFTDFGQASNAPQYYLSNNPSFGSNYHCAPQLFYFSPQKKWYLIYQSQQPQYSTTDDPSKPETWTAPQNFFSTTPDVVAANQGSGTWLDYWVICDSTNCYLFFSDDNGHWYRAQTAITDFPNGFSNTTVVMQDTNKNNLFEASNVYKLKGLNKYLALVEAIGPNGQRYFRSWTADTLDGQWTALADTWENPFMGLNNVTFPASAKNFTWDISHGEMLRDGYDETLTIDPCNLHYLYQGDNPFLDNSNYVKIPWKLALLSQTN